MDELENLTEEQREKLTKAIEFDDNSDLAIFEELQAMNKALKDLNSKDFSPEVTVEPVINVDVPEIKLPVVTVPDIKIPETVVNIDTESLKTELKGIKDVVSDKPTVSNPMPVVLVFGDKEYKAEGGGKGGNVYGGGYSLLTEENTTKLVGEYTILIDDVTTTNVTYVGKAPIGSATSSAIWQIRKLDESSTPVTLSVKWAGGNAGFSQVWNNRASLTYS